MKKPKIRASTRNVINDGLVPVNKTAAMGLIGKPSKTPAILASAIPKQTKRTPKQGFTIVRFVKLVTPPEESVSAKTQNPKKPRSSKYYPPTAEKTLSDIGLHWPK